MKFTTAFIAGAVFGVGLGVGGMLQPARVVGFLDFFGTWDPTLLLLMIGGLAVNVPLFWLTTTKRERPFFFDRFDLPTRKHIDPRLVVGSVIFGVGWAIAGYCPGPAMASLVNGTLPAVLFVVAMGAGAWLARFIHPAA